MKKINSFFFEIVSVIVSAFTVIALLFTFCFRIVGVNGTSMQNTLQPGDWLLVAPYYGEPQYGDIIITTQETAAGVDALVKRVIAGSNQQVDYMDGTFWVDGKALNEDSYTIENYGPGGTRNYPVTVPDGCVMCMGDHRSVSYDCRFENIGYFDKEYLLGRAFARLSPDWNIYSNFNQ